METAPAVRLHSFAGITSTVFKTRRAVKPTTPCTETREERNFETRNSNATAEQTDRHKQRSPEHPSLHRWPTTPAALARIHQQMASRMRRHPVREVTSVYTHDSEAYSNNSCASQRNICFHYQRGINVARRTRSPLCRDAESWIPTRGRAEVRKPQCTRVDVAIPKLCFRRARSVRGAMTGAAHSSSSLPQSRRIREVSRRCGRPDGSPPNEGDLFGLPVNSLTIAAHSL